MGALVVPPERLQATLDVLITCRTTLLLESARLLALAKKNHRARRWADERYFLGVATGLRDAATEVERAWDDQRRLLRAP